MIRDTHQILKRMEKDKVTVDDEKKNKFVVSIMIINILSIDTLAYFFKLIVMSLITALNHMHKQFNHQRYLQNESI